VSDTLSLRPDGYDLTSLTVTRSATGATASIDTSGAFPIVSGITQPGLYQFTGYAPGHQARQIEVLAWHSSVLTDKRLGADAAWALAAISRDPRQTLARILLTLENSNPLGGLAVTADRAVVFGGVV
jgi:hypothetical protein